ncbi:hypothetical protein BHE74_00026302 [Ensete ventricosum]|nr:hypothetical protein BHE74_00026302 [Ensete ventricosum]
MQPVTVRRGNMSPFAAKLPQVPGRNSPRLPRLKGAAVCGRTPWTSKRRRVAWGSALPTPSARGWGSAAASHVRVRDFVTLLPPLSSSTNSSMDGSLEDLVKRFHDLEVSQAKLRDQVQWMLEEGIEGHAHGMRRREGDDAGPFLPGHFADGPYRSVLKHIGHALHIYRPHTGEIIFWSVALSLST